MCTAVSTFDSVHSVFQAATMPELTEQIDFLMVARGLILQKRGAQYVTQGLHATPPPPNTHTLAAVHDTPFIINSEAHDALCMEKL